MAKQRFLYAGSAAPILEVHRRFALRIGPASGYVLASDKGFGGAYITRSASSRPPTERGGGLGART